jgi:hypothetical protein
VIMLGRSLIARQSAETLPVAASVGKVPAVIVEGIMDLVVSFASQAQTDDDTRRALRIYREAVGEFDVAVAAHALSWLKFHNPRNPYRPTDGSVRFELSRPVQGELI